MDENVWCLLVLVSLLCNPSAVSTNRLERNKGGRLSWGSSAGSSHGGFSLSGSTSIHLGLGGLYKGILHALEGKGRGRGLGGHDVGGSYSFDGDLGLSSSSAHHSISLKSLLKTIFSLPVRVPRAAFKFAVRFIWNIVTLNLAIVRTPVSVVKNLVTFVFGIIKTVVRTLLNVVDNINALNIDIIVGIISRIKSFVAWVIREASSVQIFGIKAGFNIATFFRDRIEGIVDGGLRFVVWVFAHLSKIFQGSLQVFRVKEILNLPGISTVVGMIRRSWNFAFEIICDNIRSVGKFVDSIIYQHQDFFIPIFRNILNFVLAIVDAYHQIQDGGLTTGIQATLGDFHIALGPLLSGFWKIRGIGGKPFGNNGNFSLTSEKGYPLGDSGLGGNGGSGGNVVLGGNEGVGGRPFGGRPPAGFGHNGWKEGDKYGAGATSGHLSGSGEATNSGFGSGSVGGISSGWGLGTPSSGKNRESGEGKGPGFIGTPGKGSDLGSSVGSSDKGSSSGGLSIPSGPGKGSSSDEGGSSGSTGSSSKATTGQSSDGSGKLSGSGSGSGGNAGNSGASYSATGGLSGTGSSSLHEGGGLSGSAGKKGGQAKKFDDITGLGYLGGSSGKGTSGSGGSFGISGGLSVNGGKPKKFHKKITF